MINIACDVKVDTNIERVESLTISSNRQAKMESRGDALPSCCHNEIYGAEAFSFFVNQGMIPEDSDRASFMYILGFCNTRPNVIRSIKWIGTKQLLREALQLMYADVISTKLVSFYAIEKGVPDFFIDKHGNRCELAKNKRVPSVLSDAMEGFFKELPDKSR